MKKVIKLKHILLVILVLLILIGSIMSLIKIKQESLWWNGYLFHNYLPYSLGIEVSSFYIEKLNSEEECVKWVNGIVDKYALEEDRYKYRCRSDCFIFFCKTKIRGGNINILPLPM